VGVFSVQQRINLRRSIRGRLYIGNQRVDLRDGITLGFVPFRRRRGRIGISRIRESLVHLCRAVRVSFVLLPSQPSHRGIIQRRNFSVQLRETGLCIQTGL